MERNDFRMPQNGIAIWILGLSGAGKSTVSIALHRTLNKNGFLSICLDGDNLRDGINKDLTFSDDDRLENIRRAAEIAKILVGNNVITICSFITPKQEYRYLAREILQSNYYEVFMDCPLEVCELRDVKGLYKMARTNGLINFTGISSTFERPLISDLILDSNTQTSTECAEILYNKILPLIMIQ